MKADHPEIFKQEKEMENEFNFKVGDKVRLPNWKETIIEITAIGKTYFLANHEGSEGVYESRRDWQLYEEPKPKPKQKLQKFYCSDYNNHFDIQYCTDKKTAEEAWEYVYTEAEFLEKFEVEI